MINDFHFWNEYETYNADYPLMQRLGLKPFRGKIWEELFVGKVETDNALIFIWVTGAPAQFWRFEIVDFGNYNTHHVSTGSGRLENYWPHIEKIAEGMFSVDTVAFKARPRFDTETVSARDAGTQTVSYEVLSQPYPE